MREEKRGREYTFARPGVQSKKPTCMGYLFEFAERGGFEPPVRLPVRQFSKLVD